MERGEQWGHFGRCGGENSFESIRTRTNTGFPPRQEIQIGETRSRPIYGSILDDVNFTTPIGIQYWSKQTDNVATPTPTLNDGGFYAIAGFLLDPINGEVGANSTLYKSSISYQEYVYRNDENKDDYYDVVKYPIVGGSGRYACASGQISLTPKQDFTELEEDSCFWVEYLLKVCNTCPDDDDIN